MTIGLLLTIQPFNSIAANQSSVIAVSKSAEAKNLLLRLNEINSMNKSNLKLSDKKNLRTEVRSIRDQLKVLDGGIYLSAGALILIIILLIILL